MDFATVSKAALLASRATMNGNGAAAVWAQRTKPLFSKQLMTALRDRGDTNVAFLDVDVKDEEEAPPKPPTPEPEESCTLEEDMRDLRMKLAGARKGIRESTEDLAQMRASLRRQRKENRILTRKSSLELNKTSAGRWSSRPTAAFRIDSRLSVGSNSSSSSYDDSAESDAELDHELEEGHDGRRRRRRRSNGSAAAATASTREEGSSDNYLFVDDEIVSHAAGGSLPRPPQCPKGQQRRRGRRPIANTRTVSMLSSYGSSRHQLSLGAQPIKMQGIAGHCTSPAPKKPRRRTKKKKGGAPKKKKGGTPKKKKKKAKSSTARPGLALADPECQDEAFLTLDVSPIPSPEPTRRAELALAEYTVGGDVATDPMAAWAAAKVEATKAAAAPTLLHPMSPESQRRKMKAGVKVAAPLIMPVPTTPLTSRRSSALTLLRRLREDTMNRRTGGNNSFRQMASSG